MHHQFAGFWGHDHRCGGRHGRRHGFGGLLGAVIGHGDMGWHDLRSRRKLGADDLQLLILALLAQKPAHGYEIIKSLEERSGGFYSPSPGMVYPALTYLEEIGHASVEADGTRKLYRITDMGRAFLEENRRTVDTILAQLKWVGEKMAHVRRAFSSERDDAGGDADDAQSVRDGHRGGLSGEVREARMRLRAALGDKRGAPSDEQRRIAEILARAADEIRGK